MLRLATVVPGSSAGRTLVAAGAALLLLGACKDGPSDPPSPSYTLTIAGGDDQNAQAGSRVGEALKVRVVSTADAPVQGVRVRFKVLEGTGATLDDSVSVSGVGGIASMGLRLGAAFPQTVKVMAFVRGQQDRAVTFTLVAKPPMTVTAVSPTAFRTGDTVTVKGQNFNTLVAGSQVYFGSVRGRILALSGDTLFRVVVPPCVAGGAVQVRVESGSAAATFTGATYTAGTVTALNAPLEGIVLSGADVGDCLRLPTNARYLLVPQLAGADTVVTSAAYTLSATSATAALQAAVEEGEAAAAAAASADGNRAQFALDMRMRALEQRTATLTHADAEAIAAEGSARLEALELGSKRTFSVLSSLTANNAFKQNTGTLKYIGAHTLLYYDDLAPGADANGFSDAQLQAFGKQFDETLYPIGVENFGAESDIDGNGRVIVLMSSIVNGLTARNCSQGSVIGFFYPHDLTKQSGSNRGEILYTFVPDPTGKFDCAHSLAEVQQVTPSTMIHEFQHMISQNQHVLARGGATEDTWLNEGLSILAEELGSRYYEDKFPSPAGRSGGAGQIFPDSSQGYILNLLRNAYDYMSAPASSSVTTFRDFGTLPERGGAWLFVRWLVDQKGTEIIPRLVQTSRTSVANVEFASGESFPSLFGDFGIALYADSLPGVPRSAIPSRYRFQTRNLRAIFGRLFVTGRVSREFPIQPKLLAFPGSVQGSIVEGSMDFATFQPATGATATVRFAPQSGTTFPAAQRAQLGILRLP